VTTIWTAGRVPGSGAGKGWPSRWKSFQSKIAPWKRSWCRFSNSLA
jgi:hypothetical protein